MHQGHSYRSRSDQLTRPSQLVAQPAGQPVAQLSVVLELLVADFPEHQ
jgi:hypothetical protein